MRYEISKVFNSKIVLFLLAAAVCFGLARSYYVYVPGGFGEKGSIYTDEGKYGAYLGTYTEEKYNLLNEKTNELQQAYEESGDEQVLMEMFDYYGLLRYAERCRDILQYRTEVRENARRMAEEGSGYYKRLNEKVYSIYKEDPVLRIEDPSTLDYIMTMFQISQRVDAAFIIVLVFFSCTVFLNEHKCKTFYMIKSSCKGHGNVYWSKQGAAFLFTILVSFLQVFSTVFFALTGGRWREWGCPVQMEELFAHAPGQMSVMGMVGTVFLMKTLGYLVLMYCFIFVSLFFKKNIFPLAFNTLLGLGGSFLNYVLSGEFFAQIGGVVGPLEEYSFVRKFLPFPLISDGMSYLKQFEPINVLGYPVLRLSFAVVCNAAFVLLGVLAGYLAYEEKFRKTGVK